jgi:hypothetical protein
MFRYKATIAVLLCCFLQATAQQTYPGGVPSQIAWCVSENQSDKVALKRIYPNGAEEVVAVNGQTSEAPYAQFNFNAATRFDGKQEPIRLSLGQGALNKISIFTVFLPADDLEEQCLWQLERNSRNDLMLTTQRLADMESRYFLELPNARKGLPVLNIYERHVKPDTLPIVSQYLIIGAQPVLPETPVQAFRGQLAEIIVYDRVLSPVERRQVETYLAIKYGIALEPYKNAGYYDTGGKMVKQNTEYLFRTAGIGRDDNSGLDQKQSSGAEEQGLLVISAGMPAFSNVVNKSALPNQSYLLWSDNGASLRLAAPKPGMPPMIGRQWEVSANDAVRSYPTALQFDTRRTDWGRRPDETWWLVCDSGGKGRFAPENTSYIPATSISPEGYATFHPILWDTDVSGRDVFSLAVAPHLFAKYWVSAPQCQPEKEGRLYAGAEGGKSPYRFVLEGQGMDIRREWTIDNNSFMELEGVKAGQYTLMVSDAIGNTYRDTLWIESSDAPSPVIASSYRLNPGQTLQLDAGMGVNFPAHTQFHWIGPDAFYQGGANVVISTPGTYVLTIDIEGCISRREIEVEAPRADPFRQLRLFPNPAPDGNFSVIVDLFQPEQVSIRITDATGRLMTMQTLHGSDYYFQTYSLPTAAGLYQVTAQTPHGAQTLPLYIQSGIKR